MQYPLELSFKIIALAPQIYVKDAQGQELLYVKQKSRFEIQRIETSLGEGSETAVLLASLVMVLLERERG